MLKNNTKYEVRGTIRFKKQFKKSIRQGKDISKLVEVLNVLGNGNKLKPKYKNHYLINDQYYKDKFVKLFDDYLGIFIDKSVSDGDIGDDCSTDYIMQQIREDFLSDSTVTIVLIGEETWKRKYVDWEISASIRNTQKNPRSGLIGIILPSHPNYTTEKYTSNIIPPRLFDNDKCGFAKIYNWSENPVAIQK